MDPIFKLFWISLVFCILADQVVSKPADDDANYSNDDTDDNYPNDDDDGNDEEGEGPPAAFKSKSLSLTVKVGDDVLLPCDTVNGETYSQMWMNGTQMMWLEDTKMINNPRVERFSNNTLLVRHAQPWDNGNYSCRIAANPVIDLVHTITVISPAKILMVTPHSNKVLKKGDSLTLACKASGSPPPAITWSRHGGHKFPNGRERMEGTSITFEEVNRKYEGMYECTAKNAFGEDKKAIKIHVEYIPEIEIEEETVTTAVGYEPEITCTVHANPEATVTWYKNGQPIKNKTRVFSNRMGNKHTLQIKEMNEADFGSYTCHAKNALGSNQKAIILSGLPTKPKVVIKPQGESHELQWKVESYSPIVEYDLQYRRVDEEEDWTQVTPNPTVTDAVEGNIFKGKEVLRYLTGPEYTIRIRAKNAHGWSQYSEDKLIRGGAATDAGGVDSIRPHTLLYLIAAMLSIYKFYI